MDVLSHMLRFGVAVVLFMCLFSNPHCTGYNYVKFIALSGRAAAAATAAAVPCCCSRMGRREMEEMDTCERLEVTYMQTHHMLQVLLPVFTLLLNHNQFGLANWKGCPQRLVIHLFIAFIPFSTKIRLCMQK